MAKKNKSVSKKDYGYYLGFVGNVLLWISILAYYIVLPLYFKNGYELIATNKYKCFMFISKNVLFTLLVFALVYFSTWGMNKKEIQVFKPISKIDLSMLFLISAFVLSYSFSSYKKVGEKDSYFFFEGAIYGANGWFMGLVTFVIMVLVYFLVTRFYYYSKYIWYPVLGVSSIIFVWGILNRYGIFPVDMSGGFLTEADLVSYLASIGNINWFAGFQSVMVPLLVGFYWAEEDSVKRKLLGILVYVAGGAVLLNGSDSAVMSYMVMGFVLLLVSVSSEKKMMRFSEVLFLFSFAGITLSIIDLIFPGVRSHPSDFSDIFMEGVSAVLIFIVAILLRFYFGMCKLNKAKYSEWAKNKLSKVLIICALAGLALTVVLITVNTLSHGALPLIGDKGVFNFDDDWGSSRGATWTMGLKTFAGLPFIHKIFGAGPDCFYFALRDNDYVYDLAFEYFGGARLTNAHCEIITLLVNTGLVGLAAFVTMNVYTIKTFTKKIKDDPYMVAFTLSVVMYLANNLFSFEQITNVPFYFLTIAMGAAKIVALEKKKGIL